MLKYPGHEVALDAALRDWRAGGPGCFESALEIDRHWETPPRRETLQVAYEFANPTGDPATETITAQLPGMTLNLRSPVELAPVKIPKPWGEEIWYTAIEARGESEILTAGGSLPLATYLSLAPERLCKSSPVVLLKVLNPRPEPVTGELYFEVHEEKREVYVVTHIDPAAWPAGTGYVRLGMDQTLRAEYADDAAFRAAFLAAVSEYEAVCRRVDAGDATATGQQAACRENVERFSVLQPLRQADVVVVPTWLPHSLQHGVRVVEFQTPTYERHIISSSQRVLTQDQWDSAAAIARMQLDPPAKVDFEVIAPGVERIVAFDEFAVWRVQIAAERETAIPDELPYAVCMVITGALDVVAGGIALSLTAEHAAFVPGDAPGKTLVNRHSQTAICLVAAPGL